MSQNKGRTSVRRQPRLTPLAVIVLGIRLVVVIVLVCITGWLLMHSPSHSAAAVAAAVVTAATAGQKVGFRITDLRFLM